VYVGLEGVYNGALQITGGDVTGGFLSVATMVPNIAASGELILGSSTANPNAITITDAKTIISNADFSGGLLLGNGGTIGSTTTSNMNAITITNAKTIISNADFSGGLLLGNGGTIGSSESNRRAIIITDTSGTIIQNADLSGTVYVGRGNRSNALKITGGDVSGGFLSVATMVPNIAASGELILGSSTANPNAIIITDTTTTINNFSFSPLYRVLSFPDPNAFYDQVNIHPGQYAFYFNYIFNESGIYGQQFIVHPQSAGRYIIYTWPNPIGGNAFCLLRIVLPSNPYKTLQEPFGVTLYPDQTFTFDVINGYGGLLLINGLGGDYVPNLNVFPGRANVNPTEP
jgi:hypothetical protein